jgi:hypothetical protein
MWWSTCTVRSAIATAALHLLTHSLCRPAAQLQLVVLHGRAARRGAAGADEQQRGGRAPVSLAPLAGRLWRVWRCVAVRHCRACRAPCVGRAPRSSALRGRRQSRRCARLDAQRRAWLARCARRGSCQHQRAACLCAACPPLVARRRAAQRAGQHGCRAGVQGLHARRPWWPASGVAPQRADGRASGIQLLRGDSRRCDRRRAQRKRLGQGHDHLAPAAAYGARLWPARAPRCRDGRRCADVCRQADEAAAVPRAQVGPQRPDGG